MTVSLIPPAKMYFIVGTGKKIGNKAALGLSMDIIMKKQCNVVNQA